MLHEETSNVAQGADPPVSYTIVRVVGGELHRQPRSIISLSSSYRKSGAILYAYGHRVGHYHAAAMCSYITPMHIMDQGPSCRPPPCARPRSRGPPPTLTAPHRPSHRSAFPSPSPLSPTQHHKRAPHSTPARTWHPPSLFPLWPSPSSPCPHLLDLSAV